MADIKISQLTELTTPTGNEELVYAYGGANGKIKLDNAGKVKVFTLSSISDLVNAQAAYDSVMAGNLTAIKISNSPYYYFCSQTVTSGGSIIRMDFTSVVNGTGTGTSYATKGNYFSYIIRATSGTVTEVVNNTSWMVGNKDNALRFISVVTALPASPSSDTIYFVTGS